MMIFRKLLLVVGCVWIVGCGNPGMVIDSEGAKEMAIAFLETNPQVEKDNQSYTLEEYYGMTDLGTFTNMTPDIEWFKTHDPLVYQTGVQTMTVNWIGVPGCELKDGAELKLGYDPELVSIEGGDCRVWWSIQVDITDSSPNEMRVRVTSGGTKI